MPKASGLGAEIISVCPPAPTNQRIMSRIRILPEQIANRIAAGEVVERPASVVKELLENSLDAGATRIEVEVEGSGTRLIRVIDNGCGMDADDLLLCLERHGTSKIATDQDLAAISSLGFRGEAIPSIGAVAKMTIISRPPQAQLGTTLTLHYGKLIKNHEIGSHYGTIFEIRELFGNTPARRKFLRTTRTELAHIEEVIKGYALAAAGVSFRLQIDGREVLRCAETQTLSDRLKTLLHYQGPLMEVGKPAPPGKPEGAPAIHGWLLPPDAAAAGSATMRLLVNGRAIRDRMMIHAVAEGLRNFLMKGRNPAGLLHLRLPPEAVDVNVHPTKQEIRFRDSQVVHQIISQEVELAIRRYQQTLQSSVFQLRAAQQGSLPVAHPPAVMPLDTKTPSEKSPSPPKTISSRPSCPDLPPASSPVPVMRPLPASPAALPPYSEANTRPEEQIIPLPQTAETTADTSALPGAVPLPAPPAPSESLFSKTPAQHAPRIIGQYDNLYIFCQAADGGLLVIDQHAAHERLIFEAMKKQFLQGHIASQILLFPATIELSRSETEQMEQHRPDIEKMGFSIREFGGNSFVISAIPALAGQRSPEELLRDILTRFVGYDSRSHAADPGGKQENILDGIIASMACRAAVKSGDPLHPQEMKALVSRMAQADLFSHCPHGRPVFKYWSIKEVQKWFYRP